MLSWLQTPSCPVRTVGPSRKPCQSFPLHPDPTDALAARFFLAGTILKASLDDVWRVHIVQQTLLELPSSSPLEMLFGFIYLDGRPEVQWGIRPPVRRYRSWAWRTVRAFKTIAICSGCGTRLSHWRPRPLRSPVLYITSRQWWWWLPDSCFGCRNGCRAGRLILWLSLVLRYIHHSHEVNKLHLVDVLGNGPENSSLLIHWYILVACWTLMCHWHLIWWRMVIPWHQTWHGVTVWPNCRLVLWRVTPPTLLSWPSVPGWQPVKGQPCLPGRQPLPDRQPLLGHPPVTSRLLVELTLDFSDTWTICIAPLLDYVDRSVVKPLCVGVDRDTRWSVEPRLLWRLLWRSRMTRQVSTAGGLTPWQVRGCRLGRWTAIPALSTRLPWRPLLSHWIVATRVGRSCCPWRWILFLTWRWWRTSVFTAVVVGWTSPFRQVPRGTMVAGVMVLAPILIPGSSVMPISARLSPGHAIGPRRAYDL